jgi:hypothetical protein
MERAVANLRREKETNAQGINPLFFLFLNFGQEDWIASSQGLLAMTG